MTCSFEANAETEDELMKKIGEHAAVVHYIKTIRPELTAKIKKAIKK